MNKNVEVIKSDWFDNKKNRQLAVNSVTNQIFCELEDKFGKLSWSAMLLPILYKESSFVRNLTFLDLDESVKFPKTPLDIRFEDFFFEAKEINILSQEQQGKSLITPVVLDVVSGEFSNLDSRTNLGDVVRILPNKMYKPGNFSVNPELNTTDTEFDADTKIITAASSTVKNFFNLLEKKYRSGILTDEEVAVSNYFRFIVPGTIDIVAKILDEDGYTKENIDTPLKLSAGLRYNLLSKIKVIDDSSDLSIKSLNNIFWKELKQKVVTPGVKNFVEKLHLYLDGDVHRYDLSCTSDDEISTTLIPYYWMYTDDKLRFVDHLYKLDNYYISATLYGELQDDRQELLRFVKVNDLDFYKKENNVRIFNEKLDSIFESQT